MPGDKKTPAEQTAVFRMSYEGGDEREASSWRLEPYDQRPEPEWEFYWTLLDDNKDYILEQMAEGSSEPVREGLVRMRFTVDGYWSWTESGQEWEDQLEIAGIEAVEVCPLCGGVHGAAESVHKSGVSVCRRHELMSDGQVAEYLAELARLAHPDPQPIDDTPAGERIVAEISLEGNNGGDVVAITQTGDQRENGACHVKVGSCCVYIFEAVVPVEFLTSLFHNLRRSNAGEFDPHNVRDLVMSAMQDWPKEFLAELRGKIQDGSGRKDQSEPVFPNEPSAGPWR